jgi:predicted aldo/keto reductase-like oxidoreductase
MIMEPLLGGKLADNLPEKAAEIFREADSERTPAAWGFNWLFDQKEVTVVLSGMNTAKMLDENLELAAQSRPGMLTQAEHEVYHKVIEQVRSGFKVPCTGCSYCMPCPHGVNIPGTFNAYNNSFLHGRMEGIKGYTNSAAALGVKTAFASQCVRCGACEKKCPQHIAIRDNLAEARKRLEPWWYKCGIKLARMFLGKK